MIGLGSLLVVVQGKTDAGVSEGFHTGSTPTSISSFPSSNDSVGTGMWSRGPGTGGLSLYCTSLEELVEADVSVNCPPGGEFSEEAIAEAMAEALAVTFIVGVSNIVIDSDCESD